MSIGLYSDPDVARGFIQVNGSNAVEVGPQYAKLPSGATEDRPATPAVGMIRFNTTTGNYEKYTGSAWNDVIDATGKITSATDRTPGRIVVVDYIEDIIAGRTNDIGVAGQVGFGLGVDREVLPSGFIGLSGTNVKSSPDYGNSQYMSDGSIMC